MGVSKVEPQWQDVKTHFRQPSDGRLHAFQPLLKSIGMQPIGRLHQAQMTVATFEEVLGGQASQRPGR